MEELAGALRMREEDLAAREQRLIQTETHRRDEAHDLDQLRTRLEAWQTKLASVSSLWHAERERRERELAEREAGLNPFASKPHFAVLEEDQSGEVSAGLATLRGDFERTTHHEAASSEDDLPWASEEVAEAEPEPNVFQFTLPTQRSRAA
jgi:hypothetical protein